MLHHLDTFRERNRMIARQLAPGETGIPGGPSLEELQLTGQFREANPPPSEIVPPEAFSFGVRLNNQGTTDRTVTVAAELRGGGEVDFLDAATVTVPAESVTAAGFDVPPDAIEVAPGTYDLVVRTEDQDIASTPFRVARPDPVAVANCTIPDRARLDQDLTLAVTVSNPNNDPQEVDLEWVLSGGIVLKRQPNVTIAETGEQRVTTTIVPRNRPAVRQAVPAGGRRFAVTVRTGRAATQCGTLTLVRGDGAAGDGDGGGAQLPAPLRDLDRSTAIIGGAGLLLLLIALSQ